MTPLDPQVAEHAPLINWLIGGAVTLVGVVVTQAATILKIGAWKHSVLTRDEGDRRYMDKVRCGEHHALIERELAAIKEQNAVMAKAIAQIQTNLAVMATQMAAEHGSSATFRKSATDTHGSADFPRRFLPLGAGEEEAAL